MQQDNSLQCLFSKFKFNHIVQRPERYHLITVTSGDELGIRCVKELDTHCFSLLGVDGNTKGLCMYRDIIYKRRCYVTANSRYIERTTEKITI